MWATSALVATGASPHKLTAARPPAIPPERARAGAGAGSSGAGAGLTARVKARTAGGRAHMIDDGGGSRLRICDRAGCDTAFVDSSRNGRRRFCSVRCANLVNVARHRLRQRRPLR
jgi:predicted RNA-binding Zn ribbon-like protein